MGTKKVFLDYYITLTEAKDVLANRASDAANPRQSLMSPIDASRIYSIPINDPEGRLLAAITPPATRQPGAAIPPTITSSWFTSKENFPIDQTGFKRKSGGWFGIAFLFGTTTYYYWRRNWQLNGDGGLEPITAESATVARRWVNGFELGDQGESNGTSPSGHIFGKHASRHTDGQGLAFRDDGAAGGQEMLVNFFGGPATVQQSWERFYVRLVKPPTAPTMFWCSRATPSPARGMMLGVDQVAALSINSSDAVGTLTPHGNCGVLALGVWTRIDLLLQYRGAGGVGTGSILVFVNGLQTASIGGPLGLDEATGLQVGSRVGKVSATTNGIELDIDDWMNAAWPTVNADGKRAGKDWRNGSRMVLVRPSGIVSLGGYTGDWRSLLQIPAGNSAPPDSVMASSTALAVLAVGMDANLTIDKYPQNKGIAAFQAAAYTLAANATNGRLGYKIPGGTPVVWTAIDNPNGGPANWKGAMYSASAVSPPTQLAGLEVHIEHPNAAVSLLVSGVAVIAEVLGRWTDCDPAGLDEHDAPITSGQLPALVRRGPHNSPYPHTPWAMQGSPPPATYRISSGTYVGTGVPRDLQLFDLPHWLFIRRTTGAVVVNTWWSSCGGAHRNLDGGIRAQVLPFIRTDPAYQAAALEQAELRSLATLLNSIDTNEVGVTYNYIAVSDPGSRFMYNDVFQHTPANANHDNLFVPPGFEPEATWLMEERETAFGANRIFYKGPGHGTLYAQLIMGSENSNSWAHDVGKLTSRASVHPAGFSCAFNSWRTNDASGDANVAKCVQLMSYTGDGTGARTLTLTPASNVRPVFAMITPHTGASGAMFRDPSHTGTTSHKMDGTADAATGIVGGGIDQILIGSALNTNGVVYDVFVLPGSAAAGNGGWSGGGEFTPVDPTVDYPGSGYPPFPDVDWPDFEGPNPFEGETPPDLDDDLDPACSPFTHRLVNIALSRIGVNLELTSMGTELVPEATQARLHYLEVVEQVLRDFPWPFATRYATLTLIAGTASVPANGDWQYAYAKPARFILARRLVRPGYKRLWDADPPAFRVGNQLEDGVDRIFTDEVDPELEYTFRPVCAAGSGDSLFRDALAWRLALAFCEPLKKDEKTFARCAQMYQIALDRATVRGSNEQGKQNPREDGDADWIRAR